MQIIYGPYLQNVTKHSITIMWHTDKPATSVVEYGMSERLGWSIYVGRPKPTYTYRVEDSTLKKIHAVTLKKLKEEWVYYYRVFSVDKEGINTVSAEATFRTAVKDSSPFSFVTYGDCLRVQQAHKRNAELARAYRANICVGAGDAAQDVIGRYKNFFNCTHELLKYTPWFATMGNHDSPNEGYFKYFSYPEPRYWYSFNYGCAHFTILNSNMDYRPGSEQYAWLKKDLEIFREARWKFVFLHHPPFCSNNCEIANTRVLCPLSEEYKVDIVYSAHATIYERFYPLTGGQYDMKEGVTYFVSGGGGYDMNLVGSELWDHIHPFSAMIKPVNHFLLTTVTPNECQVRAIDNEDRIIDSVTLTKPSRKLVSLPLASQQLSYPWKPEAGLIIAGYEEGAARWVLPRPQYAIDGETTHSGKNSICWRNNNSNKPIFPALRRVLKDDGKLLDTITHKSYQISGWIKTQNVSGGVTIGLEWNGDMGFLGRVKSKPLTGTNDWTCVKVSTPPMPSFVYSCRIILSAEPDSTGTAWFDEIYVKEI